LEVICNALTHLLIDRPRRSITGVIAMCCCIGILSCAKTGEQGERSADVILAEVYGQSLKLSDIRPLLIDISSKEDSASQVRNHVETWVREALLLHEAEINVPIDVNINKLVQDYRASLLLSTYENFLVKTLLDTVITDAELRTYYERNKNQYQLDVPILRIHYLRIRKPIPEPDQFQRAWRGDRPADHEALRVYCERHATEFLLSDSTWFRQPEVERLVPPAALTGQNMYPGRTFRFSDNDYEYHLSIRERIVSKEIAPLSYISEQARRFILHKRKIDLLEKIKRDLYEREINGDQVKIHI
jgi:hypothetical protein